MLDVKDTEQSRLVTKHRYTKKCSLRALGPAWEHLDPRHPHAKVQSTKTDCKEHGMPTDSFGAQDTEDPASFLSIWTSHLHCPA